MTARTKAPPLADPRLLTSNGTSYRLDWHTVNDNVMGGRSQGGFRYEASGVLVFSGSTNTDGGGFSSIRTLPARMDLSGATGVRVRAQGDGRRYTFRIVTEDGVTYFAEFDTETALKDIDIPFASFWPNWRGQRLPGPPLDPSRITGVGLMIYDKLDGPFRLLVQGIGTYRQQGPVSAANVLGNRT